jgi:hypothetical protein
MRRQQLLLKLWNLNSHKAWHNTIVSTDFDVYLCMFDFYGVSKLTVLPKDMNGETQQVWTPGFIDMG